jgi:hypothetical protein
MVFEAVCCIHSVLKLVETLLGMRYNKDKRMRHERNRLIQKEPALSTGTPLFRENIYVSKKQWRSTCDTRRGFLPIKGEITVERSCSS